MSHRLRFLVVLLIVLAVTGCAAGNPPAPTATPRPTLRPTFTPTPLPPTPTPVPPTPTPEPPTPTPEVPTPTPEPPTPTPEPATPTPEPVQIEVTAATVNLRGGPGTTYGLVGRAARGQRLPIVSRDPAGSWFQVETGGGLAWVINDPRLTRIVGDPAGVPIAENIPPSPTPQPTRPRPTPTPPPPTQPPPPAYAFDLEATAQEPETNMVRILLHVYAGNFNNSLTGYSLSVKKDGVALTVSGNCVAGTALHSKTHPAEAAQDHLYNCKYEFPGIPPAGRWEAQLIDAGGNPVGPPASWVLIDNDTRRELFVRYKRR